MRGMAYLLLYATSADERGRQPCDLAEAVQYSHNHLLLLDDTSTAERVSTIP